MFFFPDESGNYIYIYILLNIFTGLKKPTDNIGKVLMGSMNFQKRTHVRNGQYGNKMAINIQINNFKTIV